MSNGDLENLEVTRTLLSRLIGQTHEPCEKYYSSLLICLKILGRRASKLTQKWNEPIYDEELHQELVKILIHIRDIPIIPQEQAVQKNIFLPSLKFLKSEKKSNLSSVFR